MQFTTQTFWQTNILFTEKLSNCPILKTKLWGYIDGEVEQKKLCSINWFDKGYVNLPVKRDSRFDRSRTNPFSLRKRERFTIQQFSSLNFKHFYKQFLSLCFHYLAYTCSWWHREKLLDHAAALYPTDGPQRSVHMGKESHVALGSLIKCKNLFMTI